MSHASNIPAWNDYHLRIASDAAGIALWSWNVDTDEIAMDERAHRLWGVVKSERPVTFEDLSARIHPEDLDRVGTAFQETRAILGPYDIDFRILEGEATKWICARGRGDDSGIVGQLMFGIFLDITERKRGEEAHEMLASEMSHRVKNLFALASALTLIAARSTVSSAEMAEDLTKRLLSLGRAHDLVRPVDDHSTAKAALLGELLDILLKPYDERSPVGRRVHLSVPEMKVGENAITAVSLVVHELATNSIKYGALSTSTGTLEIIGDIVGEELVLVWTENGGPIVRSPTGARGFGSRLVTQSMSGQLGGSIDIDWRPQGVAVTLRANIGFLAC